MDSESKYTYEKTNSYCFKKTEVLIDKINVSYGEQLYNIEKLNGRYLNFTVVLKEDTIVIRYDSIDGDYKKLKEILKDNSRTISEKERKKFIKIHCCDELRNLLVKKI